MKKRIVTIFILLILVTCIILVFPVPTKHTISGDGKVLNADKEVIGDCELSIEIKEVSSLLFCYHKDFSFVLDNSRFEEFASSSHCKTDDGLCLISQVYYDEAKNSMNSCSLIYQEDFSYAIIQTDDNLYIIDQGANISYSELPVS